MDNKTVISTDSSITEIKSLVKSTYDTFAADYRTWTTQHDPDRITHLTRLLSHLKPLSTPIILELGCGSGIPTTQHLLLSLPNAHVTVNDISHTQLTLAKQNVSRPHDVHFIEGDMTALAFESGSFDAVVAMYSVLQLPRPEQGQMIEKMARWLKPGGRVLINLPDVGVEQVLERNWLGQDGAVLYWSSWDQDEYFKIFEEAGLEIESRDVSDGTNDMVFVWFVLRKG